MVDKNPLEHDRWPVSNYSRAAEYLYLYTVDSNEPYIDTVDWYYDSYFLKRINGARWDTNQPRMLCIPAYVDGHAPYNRFRDEYCPAYQYCYLYEAHFDSAVTVEGEFWIAGTYNSNIQGRYLPVWLHYPTEYLSWGAMTGRRYKILSGTVDGPWRRGDYDYTLQLQAGPFGVITDYQWFVHAATADSAQGMALGTDYCTDSTQVTISAVPNRGFRFLHWNDGNTDNPRSVYLTSDTAFTAFFRPEERYVVDAFSSDTSCGTVVGSGVYPEGSSVTLAAAPRHGFLFQRWNDLSTDNYDLQLLKQGYQKLLQQVRRHNPQAKILFLTGSMLGGKELQLARQLLDEVAAEARKAGDQQVYRFDLSPIDDEAFYGNDYHPNVYEDEKMAAELSAYLRKLMGWF